MYHLHRYWYVGGGRQASGLNIVDSSPTENKLRRRHNVYRSRGFG
jgi:hypothetical protein